MSFNSLGLSFDLHIGLGKNGFHDPFPIQEQAIPLIIQGHDLLGIAKTGSGKTAAYALPLLMKVEGNTSKNRFVQTLVLVPTRELCLQVSEVFSQFAKSLSFPVKVLAVHGGVSINPQMKGLMGTDILVATPGRLIELLGVKAVNLSSVKTLVLDEADKMLNLDFQAEMQQILSLLPTKRQNLLFSATLSPAVQEIQQLILNKPKVVEIVEEIQNISQINQIAYLVEDSEKGPSLRRLIEELELKQVLVFTSSTRKADNVAAKLLKNGVDARAIHGEKSQGSRTQALSDFKTGKLRVLVATDLLSRGIDIAFLPYVINYELPRSPKDYIHRIGRTGRASAPGTAISIVSEGDRAHFKVIQKKMGTWAEPVALPWG